MPVTRADIAVAGRGRAHVPGLACRSPQALSCEALRVPPAGHTLPCPLLAPSWRLPTRRPCKITGPNVFGTITNDHCELVTRGVTNSNLLGMVTVRA